MSKISDDEKNGVGVKPLGEWRRGYCDERVTIQQASFGGMYQVRVLDGAVWLDWPTRTAEEFETVDLAKAAAQADYERLILSALTNTDLPLRAENERLKKERDEWKQAAHDVDHSGGLVLWSDKWSEMLQEYKWAYEDQKKAEAKLEEAAKVLGRALIGNPTVESPEDHVQHLAGCIETVLANLKGAE